MRKIFKVVAAFSPFVLLKATVAKAAADVAEGLSGAGNKLEDVGAQVTDVSGSDLPTLIGSIINIALGLLGILLVVLVVYSGFLWMTAAGSKEQVTKAKEILTRAIIGIIIVVAAYAISDYVISAITTAATRGV
ncbi:MAG: hypothetical protein V1695_02175 [Candidatus Uhrbacteria bacterium]